MKKFWCYITNGSYSVGCTSRMVYLYDSEGTEIASFKDLPYGHKAVFSPADPIFVVKSTKAYFAVYSVEARALLHKIKFSNVNGGQDDGFCFSPDGKYFINIERQKRSTNSSISIYETKNYTRLLTMYADDEKTEPKYIEFGTDKVPYVIGFLRGENGVMNQAFVAKLGQKGLLEMRILTEEEFEFYMGFKRLEMLGFTEEAKKWLFFDSEDAGMTGIENETHPLKDLWESKGNQTKISEPAVSKPGKGSKPS